MNVVLYGATGKSGSRILKELLARGHQVTAIVREPDKVSTSDPHLLLRQGDLSDARKIAAAINGADAVISAYGPPQDKPEEIIGVTKRQIEALAQRPNTRLIVVGGAGGLNVAPGVSLVDSKLLPESVLPIARAHVQALNLLKASSIEWTYFAPAAFFVPGERTGKFRLGKDELIANAQHESRISMEDYAIALVVELEKPRLIRQRFSIGY
jgi:uncharacterized protein